jgi:hypothetical protein
MPAAPFAAWPIQFRHRDFGFAWVLPGATIVTQSLLPRGLATGAYAANDWIDLQLRLKSREVEANDGCVIIHDWQAITSYERSAYEAWEIGARKRARICRKAITVVRDTAILRLAVASINAINSLIRGGSSNVELATNLHAVLRNYDVRPPRAN